MQPAAAFLLQGAGAWGHWVLACHALCGTREGRLLPTSWGTGSFSAVLGDQRLLALGCLSLVRKTHPVGAGFPTGWWTAPLGRLPSSWGSWRQVLLGSSAIKTCLGCSLWDKALPLRLMITSVPDAPD